MINARDDLRIIDIAMTCGFGNASEKGLTREPFLSEKNLTHLGLEVVDEAGPCFELMTMPRQNDFQRPRFWDSARRGEVQGIAGVPKENRS